MSTLFTVNEQAIELPTPSVAVKKTVVVPVPVSVVPATGNWVTLGVPQLSAVLTALYKGNVAEQEASKINVCVAGQVISGGVMSKRLTSNEHEVELPFPSLAVKTTVVVPTPVTVLPAVGDCVTLCVPQLSDVLKGLYKGKVALQALFKTKF